MSHFYNSITLLGEFYNRLHQKSHPVLIIGRSLIELLTKELKNECAKCTNDPKHVFNVQFARLLLTQVSVNIFALFVISFEFILNFSQFFFFANFTQITINGSLAKTHHSNEIDSMFYELRKCLIEVPNLAAVTKSFLLMSFDLYYSGFKNLGTKLNQLYSKFLDEHDTENRSRHASKVLRKETKVEEPTNSYSLRNLRLDFAGLKTNGGNSGNGGRNDEQRKINREYLNRPLKASDRLKYFQNSNSELTRRDDASKSTNQLRASNSDMCLSQQTNSLNNNQSDSNESSSLPSISTTTKKTSPTNVSSARPALLTISSNCKDSVVSSQPSSSSAPSPTKPETSVTSPTESFDSGLLLVPKLENFNWFEAVEREEIGEFTPNLNNSGGSSSNNKLDTISCASYSSNPASPPDRVSPQSSHPNRSRRNSLNRFRSEFYRQSNEDLHQNEKRSNRNDGKQSQNYHQSWRAGGGRNSPRNDSRNGYNKRSTANEYDRENSNNNGRHSNDNGGNYNNRRNLIRGGSVDFFFTFSNIIPN